MKILITILLILTLVLTIGCTGNVVKEDTVKVGWIGPLAGEFAKYGLPQMQATKLAVNEINSNGGINGKKLEIIYEDGQCNPKDATTAMHRLINLNNVKVAMVFCSTEMMGVAPIAEENKIIIFSPFAGSPDITNAGDYIFRNFPSDATTGKKIAQVMQDLGYENVAVMAELTDYSQPLKRVFKENFEGNIVAEEDYEPNAKDFRSQLTKIKNSEADALYFIPLNPVGAVSAIKQMVELDTDFQLFTNEVTASNEIISEHGKALEGMIFAEPVFDKNNPLFKTFENKYFNLHGEFVNVPPFYYAANYDAVYLLAEAIEKNGLDTDKIRDYLYTIENREGVAGTLTIDSNGDPLYEYSVKQVKNGELVEI
jgi:branched-chain amino acid transport system substrate-binding protein